MSNLEKSRNNCRVLESKGIVMDRITDDSGVSGDTVDRIYVRGMNLIYAIGIDDSAISKYYYLMNFRGDIVALTNQNGTQIATFAVTVTFAAGIINCVSVAFGLKIGPLSSGETSQTSNMYLESGCAPAAITIVSPCKNGPGPKIAVS